MISAPSIAASLIYGFGTWKHLYFTLPVPGSTQGGAGCIQLPTGTRCPPAPALRAPSRTGAGPVASPVPGLPEPARSLLPGALTGAAVCSPGMASSAGWDPEPCPGCRRMSWRGISGGSDSAPARARPRPAQGCRWTRSSAGRISLSEKGPGQPPPRLRPPPAPGTGKPPPGSGARGAAGERPPIAGAG